MKNKRALLISAVVILAILLVTAGFLAHPRPVESAHPIPVTGLADYEDPLPYQLSRQMVEYFRPYTNQWDAAVQEKIWPGRVLSPKLDSSLNNSR
jgi:hypothetical protein